MKQYNFVEFHPHGFAVSLYFNIHAFYLVYQWWCNCSHFLYLNLVKLRDLLLFTHCSDLRAERDRYWTEASRFIDKFSSFKKFLLTYILVDWVLSKWLKNKNYWEISNWVKEELCSSFEPRKMISTPGFYCQGALQHFGKCNFLCAIFRTRDI